VASALYASSDLTINGDIGSNAQITATAGQDNAAGLCSVNGSITTGAIDGTITADANGSVAYALFSSSDLTINGDIGSSALISATAGQDNAYGLYSDNGSINTGAIDGNITATAGTNNAYALLSSGSISTGDIDGQIYAETTNGSYAYGLYSYNNDVNTGAINGTITADANTSDAYAMASNGDLTVDGNIGSSAVISATAGTSYAYGLRSINGSITTGAIDGNIAATTGTVYAYGLYSGGSIDTGDIGGIIDANAGSSYAYGLYSQSGDVNTGDIDGSITATANNTAAGMYSGGSLTTGAIGGTIDANAGVDFAYGILSYGPMDVTVDGGTVSAVANGGTHAAAIQSGRIGGSGLDIQDANDTVEVVAGSAIVGDIDLTMDGTDDDLLTLSGLDTNSTTFDDDLLNIETINITGGQWYINGDILNSANGISMDGGILGGTGNLGSLNVGGGTLAPGSSIGTITIYGNLTFEPDSTFEVEVNNTDQADLAIVTEAANLDGTIHGVALDNIDHSFSAIVLDANTGLNGQFATVDGNTAFLMFSVDYNTTDYDVILNVDPIPDLAYYSLTGNQGALGNLFNDLEGTSTDEDMNDVIDEIRGLPDGDAVNNAYNQMIPQDRLGLPEVIRRTMNQYNDNIMDRMDGVRRGRLYTRLDSSRYLLASADNAIASPPKTDEWKPFVKGFGIWGDRDPENGIAGYDYSVYGAVAGMDKLVSDDMLFGFGLGGATANVDYSFSADADIDSFLCSLYGSYFKDDWHFDWTAAYSHNWYNSQRSIHFGAINRKAESDHQGNAYSVAIEFGKNFGGSSMILEPIAGVGYTAVQENGYKEKGAGALNLKVDSDTTDGFYSKLGIRMAKEFRSNPDMVIVPKVNMFWIHDFAERVEVSSSFIGDGSFATKGHDPEQDLFNVGAALNIYLNDNKRFFVDYVWQSSSDFTSNMLHAGVQWSF